VELSSLNELESGDTSTTVSDTSSKNNHVQTDIALLCPSSTEEQFESSATELADVALEEQVQALEIVQADAVPTEDSVISANSSAASLTSLPCPVSGDTSSALPSHDSCSVSVSSAVYSDGPSQCSPTPASTDHQPADSTSSHRKKRHRSSKKSDAMPLSSSNANQCM